MGFGMDSISVFCFITLGVVVTSGSGVAFRFKGPILLDFLLLAVSFGFALSESTSAFTSSVALVDARLD